MIVKRGLPRRKLGFWQRMPKKERGLEPRSEICVDPLFPRLLILILMSGTALPCWAPGFLPRLGPPELDLAAGLRGELLDHYFHSVTHFSNECSKLKQLLKRMAPGMPSWRD